MNSLNKIITFILLSLFLSSGILFAQGGAQKEGTLRDGAEIGAITELDIHTNIELTTNYVTLFDCADYKPVGVCIKLFPFRFRLMMRYFVPFQLTEGNTRIDSTGFVQRQRMINQIIKPAFETVAQGRNQYMKLDHENIKNQRGGENLEFPGETEDKLFQDMKDFHNKDLSNIGMSGAHTYTTNSYAVGTNHEWHNQMRDQSPFSEEENPFGWCHDYSRHAFSGRTEEHPKIDPFTSLGVLQPKKPEERMIPLFAFFASMSQTTDLKDIKDRTPKQSDPILTACYRKKHQNGIQHPETFGAEDGGEILVPEAQQGTEQSDKICPGFGFLGPAGPFWIFAKSSFAAGNSLMSSLRGLVMAFNTTVDNPDGKHTVDHDTGRHRLHSYTNEFGYPSDHMQLIWPKPGQYAGWPKGCGETKGKGFYIPPQWRPEDSAEASIVEDQNFGQHYRMAHYTSIVCCPRGWIPITTERLKNG